MPKLTKNIPVEHLLSKQLRFWNTFGQLSTKEKMDKFGQEPWQFGYITISRLLGSGAAEIAQRVAELLHWHVFDKELVHEIANSSKMRNQVIESLDEKRQNEMQRWVQGIIDSDTISSDRYLKHLMHVIVTIASHGKCIFIGRGANFILESHKGVRVKLHAPEQLRIRRIKERSNVNDKEAARKIREADNQRLAFIRGYFHRDADDPSAYDLIMNTGEICPEVAAHLIKETLIQKYKTLLGLEKCGETFIQAG